MGKAQVTSFGPGPAFNPKSLQRYHFCSVDGDELPIREGEKRHLLQAGNVGFSERRDSPLSMIMYAFHLAVNPRRNFIFV